MSSITYTNLFTRVTEKQASFDFMIKKEDFYINTHGVSVSDVNKSTTSINDGLFYVLNKNNKPIYFNGIYLQSVRMRNERTYPTNSLRISLKESEISGNFLYEKFNLSFRGRDVGELTIGRLSSFSNNNNVLINPFQSIELSVNYRVINPGDLANQYFGKSRSDLNKTKGTIDMVFAIRCFADKNLTQQINDTITFSVNVVNTN